MLKEGSIISESHLKRWIEMVSCKHSDQFQFQSTVIHSSGLQWSSLGRLRQTWQNHRSWLANPRTQWKLTSYSRDNTIPYHYITLHYTTLHYITLQYITVHYSTLPYIPYMTIIYKLGNFPARIAAPHPPPCCSETGRRLGSQHLPRSRHQASHTSHWLDEMLEMVVSKSNLSKLI